MDITVVACMKNEGPFILEWLAHHRAIGANRFIIFSNDCTDGTKELLDCLDDAGIIRHLENPNCLVNSNQRINVAFSYAQHLKEYQRAEYVALIDVDEFINVTHADGTLPTLIGALDPFDVLSFNHVNFGFGGVTDFDPGPITGQFFFTGGEQVGAGTKARTAIKSLHRVRDDIVPFNHFPTVAPESYSDVRWCDGSGNALEISTKKPRRKMLQVAQRVGKVQLNHYVLRSAESFLVKHDRGNVFGFDKIDAMRYATEYNHNRIEDRSILQSSAIRDAETQALLALPGIAERHENCVSHHRARIRALRDSDAGADLFAKLKTLMASEQATNG
ncbi:glycosyltransferase family 2 protein [Roseovarius sp. 2305UL8-3]|uniref:glycosyltransferase family 2 protein n=1 Tax=Roseovarius conchicola TaxID=3121636 RepID=UPI00352822E3